MNYVGIDIGSTAAKVCIESDLHNDRIYKVLATGWSGVETAKTIRSFLEEKNIHPQTDDTKILATGYGRVSVSYADYQLTEISCHGKGAMALTGLEDLSVIDIGGQDTKAIKIKSGKVDDFLMNDKCSAGTGRFIEIMSSRLGLSIDDLFAYGSKGQTLPISSMCTVFAESEVISHIGAGEAKEDIANGVIDGVSSMVAQLAQRIDLNQEVYLTGGLSKQDYLAKVLSDKLNRQVKTLENGQFAGALGACVLAKEKSNK